MNEPNLTTLRPNVRRANKNDLDALTILFDAYRVFYKAIPDPENARAFLAERLNKEESVIFIAISDNGTALGFTQLFPSFSSVSMKRLWILRACNKTC